MALALALGGAAVHSARADTPDAPTGVAAPAVATPPGATAAPAPAPAVPAAPAASAPPIGRFEDDQVRRGATAASPAGTTSAGGSTNGYDLPRVLGALAAVIGLIFLLRWLGKRFFAVPSAQRSTRVVQVLSRSALSPKQQLVLVRVGQRVLVAADNGSQLSPLSEITDPDEVASLLGQLQSEKEGGAFGSSSAKAFSSMFGRWRKTHETEATNEDFAGGGSQEDDEPDPNHEPQERADLEDPEFAASLLSSPVSVSTENVVAATRQELNGLMEKVRFVSDQFGRAG